MPTPELDVLIASATWLWQRGVTPIRISIAQGSEAGKYEDQRRLESAFERAGIPREAWSRTSGGPDIIGVGNGEAWQVECKGEGSGRQQTQRNNFDRALASVVSYYGNAPGYLADQLTGTPIIALAIPPTADYLRELRRRVSDELRRALHMWVLLCEPSGPVQAISPGDTVPR